MRVVLFDRAVLVDAEDGVYPGAVRALEDIQRGERGREATPVFALLLGSGSARENSHTSKQLRELFTEPGRQVIKLEDGDDQDLLSPDTLWQAVSRADGRALFEDATLVTARTAAAWTARRLGMHVACVGERECQTLTDLVPAIRDLIRIQSVRTWSRPRAGHVVTLPSSKPTDEDVWRLVKCVNASTLQEEVEALARFGSRHATAPQTTEVAEYLYDRFIEFRYAETHIGFQPFPSPGPIPQQNVLCGPKQFQKPVVMVCAHYDSKPAPPPHARGTEPPGNAPGANDNASGVAAILEIARILQPIRLPFDLIVAAFGSEEVGLLGSAQCAQEASAKHWPLDLVINLDMVGYASWRAGGSFGVEVKADVGGESKSNDAASEFFSSVIRSAGERFAELATRPVKGPFSGRDSVPFERHGFVCVDLFEGGFYEPYHSSNDLPSELNYPYLAQVTRMVLATLLILEVK